MTVNEVKERLRQYRRMCRECRSLERQIKCKRRDMENLRAVKSDALPGGGGNSLESAIEKIDMMERQLLRLKRDTIAAKIDVEALIALADDKDGVAFMWLYFIDGVSINDIANKHLFRSRSSIYAHYRTALEQIWTKITRQ